MLRLYYDKKEFNIATGYSVSPKQWNPKKQCVTGKFADDINAELVSFSAKTLDAYNKVKHLEVNNQLLKDLLLGKDVNLDGVVRKTKNSATLHEHIENVIYRKQKEGTPQSQKRAGKYAIVYERLKEFESIYYKRELSFNDIDLDFYSKLMEYLKKDRNLADSTVQGHIKVLKRFLNVATVEGINTNLIFKSSEFKAPQYKKKHIYISEEELNKLYRMELKGHLDKTRDIFIIGCRTGLRVSDYWRCVGDTVDENGLICIDDTQKTGEPVFIPMHWQVKEILAKYDGKPPAMSGPKLNDYLKELGKTAEFNNLVTDTRPHASGKCPRYELMTTHTARRSCATNMYLSGFDLYFIHGILGHTKMDTTIKYLGITRKIVAMKYSSHPYFAQKNDTVTK
jgi:integrase